MESPDVTYLRIEWNVKNIFSVRQQEIGHFSFRKSMWKLVLEKVTIESTERLRVLLKETEAIEVSGNFVSRVFIEDKHRTPMFLSEKGCVNTSVFYFYNDCVWSMDVKDLRRKEDILSTGDAVSFVCILASKTISEDTGNKPVQAYTNVKAEGSVETLILDFRRLLEDNALSDVTLKCGDRAIPAHRNILSARSEVFAAMFRNDMAESRSGVIEVSDMDPKVLEHLLQFIYSCKLPDMSMDAAAQLYEAADKYSVESLKNVCSAFMTQNLTEKNACSILLLADSHSDGDLKDCVVSFIVKTKLFKKDDIWLKFCKDHPILAVEVLNIACKGLS